MGINPTIQLSIVRSRIDQQQQVIALLEQRLQEAILGGTTTSVVNNDQTLPGLIDEIATIYGDNLAEGYTLGNGSDPRTANLSGRGSTGLTNAIWKGVFDFDPYTFGPNSGAMVLEQDGLRQLLYQARALLGELRVEEQHWNGEVNEEKSRRKELGDLSKA
jgi:hypothetical protein